MNIEPTTLKVHVDGENIECKAYRRNTSDRHGDYALRVRDLDAGENYCCHFYATEAEVLAAYDRAIASLDEPVSILV